MEPRIDPSLINSLKNARAFTVRLESLGCGGSSSDERSCGPEYFAAESEGGFGGGAFGVRRPLRFMTYKLGLSEPQVTELARILDELKIERAQAAVDDRRTLAAFADAVSSDDFDGARAAPRVPICAARDRRASPTPWSRRWGESTSSCRRSSASGWPTSSAP